jgi:hypothetical protein
MIHGSCKFLILQKSTLAFAGKSPMQIKNGKDRLYQIIFIPISSGAKIVGLHV